MGYHNLLGVLWDGAKHGLTYQVGKDCWEWASESEPMRMGSRKREAYFSLELGRDGFAVGNKRSYESAICI